MLSNYTYLFKFFTTWSLIMVMFHKYLYKYVNLLLITFITLVIGLYLSFINPRRFVWYFDKVRYEYTGLQKFIIVDMIFHLLVFYYIYSLYGKYYTSKTFFNSKTFIALSIYLIYILTHDIKKLYGINKYEGACIFVVSLILYVMLFMR